MSAFCFVFTGFCFLPFDSLTFSIGYLAHVFPDYGAKLRSAVFALGTVLGDSIEDVADGDTPGIAATFEQTVAVERFLYLVTVSLDDIGKLPLCFVVVAENPANIFLMSG